jgi:hypothetical protein
VTGIPLSLVKIIKRGTLSDLCYTPVILATPLLRPRQESWEFQASLGYIVRPCLKINNNSNNFYNVLRM